jgi:hypothetical protein
MREKNKKGDIPTFVLTLGVFIVCGLALVSFWIGDQRIVRPFQGTGLVEDMNAQIEEYNFYKSIGTGDEELKETFDIREDLKGKYLYLEMQYPDDIFTILKAGKRNLLSIKYYLRK